MDSLNRMALELVDEAIDFADELDLIVSELDGETTVLDFGVEAEGGLEAGLLLVEIQTAGLATVQTRMDEVGGVPMPFVEFSTDQPALSVLCSQKAGWELGVEDFEGLGSGPARALVAEEEEFARVGYEDVLDFAVLTVESEDLPTASAARQVAELAEVDTGALFLPAFSTASLVGSVNMAARGAELAVFRLSELGYDPLDIVTASASAPVAPVAGSEEAAIGRTNDALAYGGRAHVVVREEFDRFSEVASTASEEYGRPFAEIFEDVDWELYDVPESIFAPAQVTIDVLGGGTYHYGQRNEELLTDSFGL
ncbi:methenyltetrahydromethanopterin cyclohydrolase [Halalkalicoccus paucihalophilus]|uniref:Methenyltetrahydromethanopterin cyclohydrolase n=1 Tax=Halalkalicoccus paucihalophilus TaxID=1008153 RepID=A0A151AFD7_9EURY|nr:methenyltetrahydromethanopterin cyclohydrolase [Halalkalicoccus paucihalophilus]KYH26107.1 methenyltetrahydromethanopterin cyclohydrolase [Halalkalicoccus paucihalophilus]